MGGQDASEVSNGTYGFAWNIDNGAGSFRLSSEDEPNKYTHPFEIHKLHDGRYKLIGYVDTDSAKAIQDGKLDIALAIYAHRWERATEIVSLPIGQLSNYSNPEQMEIDGKRHYVIKAQWK